MIKVYVWLPKNLNVGHSSLEISNADLGYQYISWWPITENPIKENPGGFSTFENDVASENEEPHEIFEINGLDESKVIDWWVAFSTNNRSSYSLGKYNCSWAVIKALKAGGSDNYFPWYRFLDKHNTEIILPNLQNTLYRYIHESLKLLISNSKPNARLALKIPLINIVDKFTAIWSPTDVANYARLLTASMDGEDSIINKFLEAPYF